MKITIERETFDHSYIINIDNKIAFISKAIDMDAIKVNDSFCKSFFSYPYAIKNIKNNNDVDFATDIGNLSLSQIIKEIRKDTLISIDFFDMPNLGGKDIDWAFPSFVDWLREQRYE